MKCVRDTGCEQWAKWHKSCDQYHKKFWKQTSPYIKRNSTCARTLTKIMRKNKKIGLLTSYRALNRKNELCEYFNITKDAITNHYMIRITNYKKYNERRR